MIVLVQLLGESPVDDEPRDPPTADMEQAREQARSLGADRPPDRPFSAPACLELYVNRMARAEARTVRS